MTTMTTDPASDPATDRDRPDAGPTAGATAARAPRRRRPHPAQRARTVSTIAAGALTAGMIGALAGDALGAEWAAGATSVDALDASAAPSPDVPTAGPAEIVVVRRIHVVGASPADRAPRRHWCNPPRPHQHRDGR